MGALESGSKLRTPLSKEEVLGLRAGDAVYLSGIIYTARDLPINEF